MRKSKQKEMSKTYMEFTIKVFREQSIPGDEYIFYNVTRNSDGWELDTGQYNSEMSLIECIYDIQGVVDDFYENPNLYED